MNPKYISSISELDNLVGLAQKERENMETVTDLFPFQANDYYLSLVDWKDRHDPLYKIVIPNSRELKRGGSTDLSCEKNYTKKPGLQHTYDQTDLLPLIDTCTGLVWRVWYMMVHVTEAIKMGGTIVGHIFMRYYRSADQACIRKCMIFENNPMGCFDNYRDLVTNDDAFLPQKYIKKHWLL